MEAAVKSIFKDLLAGKDFGSLLHSEAHELARWAVIKSLLIALTLQRKLEFSPQIYRLLKEGFIPEGFIVEMDRFQEATLNFMFQDGTKLGKSFDISQDDLNFAMADFIGCCLQVKDIAFRVSFLRTPTPIYRVQVVKPLFVAYPFKGRMPFNVTNVQPSADSSLKEIHNMAIGLWVID